MGMKVAAPDRKSLPNDRTETYLKCLREIIKEQLQIVVMIMPTPRDDRYSAVKKLCNVEQPVPSQVINYKTLSNEKKASSVVQKVALQVILLPNSLTSQYSINLRRSTVSWAGSSGGASSAPSSATSWWSVWTSSTTPQGVAAASPPSCPTPTRA